MESRRTPFGTRANGPVSVFHTQLGEPSLKELYTLQHGWSHHHVASDATYAEEVWRVQGRYKNGVDVYLPDDVTIAPAQTVLVDLKITAVCSKWESITPMIQCLRAMLFGLICGAVAVDGAPKTNALVNSVLVYAFFEMDHAVTFVALCSSRRDPSEGELPDTANPNRNHDPTKITAIIFISLIAALLTETTAMLPVFVLFISAAMGHLLFLSRLVCRPDVGFSLVPCLSFNNTGCIHANSPAVIAPGQKGTLHVPIYNTTDGPVLLKRGQSIAQLCGAFDTRAVGVYYDADRAADIPQIFRA